MKPARTIREPILTMIVQGPFDVRFTSYYCNYRSNGVGIWRSLYWAMRIAASNIQP